MLRFTEEHEWLKLDGDEVIVGITEYAAEQLGDLVFVELPEEGRTVAKGDEIVTIESVKAASDIVRPDDYLPLYLAWKANILIPLPGKAGMTGVVAMHEWFAARLPLTTFIPRSVSRAVVSETCLPSTGSPSWRSRPESTRS